MRKTSVAAIAAGAATLAAAAGPARVPVLGQIELPHNYYYRELYLPQLTSGPSSATWTPDGTALIYSMQGTSCDGWTAFNLPRKESRATGQRTNARPSCRMSIARADSMSGVCEKRRNEETWAPPSQVTLPVAAR